MVYEAVLTAIIAGCRQCSVVGVAVCLVLYLHHNYIWALKGLLECCMVQYAAGVLLQALFGLFFTVFSVPKFSASGRCASALMVLCIRLLCALQASTTLRGTHQK